MNALPHPSSRLIARISKRRSIAERHFHCCISHNSNSFIPDPTWSTRDLRLSSVCDEKHDMENKLDDIASSTNLKVLAKRSLIDIDSLSLERRVRLERDLRGIMRCVSVLADDKNEFDGPNISTPNELSYEDIYDIPRGFNPVHLPNELYNNEKHEEIRNNLLQNIEHKLVKAKINTSETNEEDKTGSFFSVLTDKQDKD